MKLFLDQNKTLLPRIDTIFVLTRTMTFLGLLWFVNFGAAEHDAIQLYLLAATYLAQLLFFVGQMKSGRDLKLGYLSAIIYDIIFVPMYISYSGAIDSSLYLLYYLTISVAAYVLTFWFAFGVALIITLIYTALSFHELTLQNSFSFAMRIGFLWVYSLALSYASDYLRRSERRLMKLFDTLNMRTSELEKSQAQVEMIYENTRILAAILSPDNVIREVMRILGTTLAYTSFAIVFHHRSGEFYYRARSIDGKNNYHPKAIDRTGVDLIRRVADVQESIRVKNLSDRPDYVPLNDKARSFMIVPMTSHSQTQGILIAEAETEDFFTDRDVKLLTIVARSAAMALENADLHRRTEELTIIDELTETYNYRYFVQKLQEEKKRAVRYQLPLSMIMVDIDWFKKLNDTFGHEVGNIVLRKLSVAIKHCIRDVDIFARYGGEEFVVILPQTPLSEACRIGDRIREYVEAMVIDGGSAGKLRITVSVGISSYPENGKSEEELLSIADQALYRAKGSGKNIVCVV